MQAIMLVALPFFLTMVFLGGFHINLPSASIAIPVIIVALLAFVGTRLLAVRSKFMDVLSLLIFIGLCIWLGLGKYVLILVLLILIKNTNPRMRIDQAMRFFWVYCGIALVVAVVLASVGYYFGISWL
jgi:formate hydrogenlyase subunit 4